MGRQDNNIKQLYDQCTAMITKLHLQKNALNQPEMYFLLSVLDMIVLGKKTEGFLEILQDWQASKRNEEIDDIIKATLLQIDFNDQPSVQRNMAIIADLLAYNPDSDLN